MSFRKYLMASAAGAVVLTPGVAMAQGAGANDSNVIVVTANKR